MDFLRARGGKNLVDELRRSHRALTLTIVGMLVLNLMSSGFLLLVSQPRIASYTALTSLSRLSHEAMLDQETGLRGWLATGDPDFLEPYTRGRGAVEARSDELLERAAVSPAIVEQVVTTMLARAAWQTWAQRGATMQVTESDRATGALSQFLLEGKDLFDTYRQVDSRATALVVGKRDAYLAQQRSALIVLPFVFLLASSIVGIRARTRRRQLARTLLEPIRELLATVEALGAGDLAARTKETGVAELDAMGSALRALAGDLSASEERASAREHRLARLAAQLEMVVRVTREVSGSLSVRYVSEAVTSAAAELLGAPATLWVRTEDGHFTATRRSTDPHGRTPPSDLPVPPSVDECAAAARPVINSDSRAYPLVLAGMVVGVLHASTPLADEDIEPVLEALLSTAAAALESARLNRAAHERADVDAITRLPNRRRMDSDLQLEWERSRRYHRPLTFIMIDLDHFKRLNDTYGHPIGDAALREVAIALQAGLRATDTAYRYGGEEFGVLLRETDLDAGAIVAEQLRAAIATVVVVGSSVALTASLGVAERAPEMRDLADLIAAADAALYTAKRTGRDRVVEHPQVHAS